MARQLWDSAAKWTIVSISSLGQGGRHRVEVADVALDEDDPVLDVGQVGPVAGVGEHVVGDDMVVGVLLDPVADEVRPDEAGTPGHEKAHSGPMLAPGVHPPDPAGPGGQPGRRCTTSPARDQAAGPRRASSHAPGRPPSSIADGQPG